MSLRTSFWWIFLLPFLAVLSIPRLADFIAPHVGQDIDVVLTVFLFGVFLSVYVWQVVGVLRAADIYARDGNDRQWAIAAQGTIVVSALFVIAVLVGSVQHFQLRKQVRETASIVPAEKKYQLEVDEARQTVAISGNLDVGITRAVRNLLDATPGIRRVVLSSYGGRVYEGRGLLKLIRERSLDTHVDEVCYSACTLAFIGGTRRTLGRDGKLGFHRYKSYTMQINVDVESEQRKDMLLFARQGINEAFARKVYTVATEDIWEPTVEELVRYSVLTGGN